MEPQGDWAGGTCLGRNPADQGCGWQRGDGRRRRAGVPWPGAARNRGEYGFRSVCKRVGGRQVGGLRSTAQLWTRTGPRGPPSPKLPVSVSPGFGGDTEAGLWAIFTFEKPLTSDAEHQSQISGRDRGLWALPLTSIGLLFCVCGFDSRRPDQGLSGESKGRTGRGQAWLLSF